MMPEKIIYTYEQMCGDLQEITRQATLNNFRPHAIVGIARGGIVPATMLSHFYNVPLYTLNLSLRDGKVFGVPEYQKLREMLVEETKLLLVDDICDSGETLAIVRDELATLLGKSSASSHMDFLRTAVLWNNTAQDLFEADYVGREISRAEDKRWVIFPYEEWWKA